METVKKPNRRTDDLAKGRTSLPCARYFITCRAAEPFNGLDCSANAAGIHQSLERLQQDGDLEILCFTIMPDHVHLLFALGSRITVSQVVGKFKTMACRNGGPYRWQRNFFEHRLRPDEVANNYARYIFMNPYRAALINQHDVWPHWRCGESIQFDFQQMLNEGGSPPVEWFALQSDDTLLPEGVRSSM